MLYNLDIVVIEFHFVSSFFKIFFCISIMPPSLCQIWYRLPLYSYLLVLFKLFAEFITQKKTTTLLSLFSIFFPHKSFSPSSSTSFLSRLGMGTPKAPIFSIMLRPSLDR